MSEGKWVEARHKDIREDDTVRVTAKDGPRTIITEGKVTNYAEPIPSRGAVWAIEDFENFFDYEFVPDAEGYCSTLEKFVPAFEWPTKLGAVVTGRDGNEVVHAVLVNKGISQALWWTNEWGTTTASDLSGLEDLTVVSEGVTVEP